MTPPSRVERQPRSACVEPVTDVKRCVEETLRDEGLGWLWDSGWAPAVVYCESRWNPYAESPGRHKGLWQIHPNWINGVWAALPGDWANPEDNTRMAAHVYRVQGPRAWACAPW